MLNILTADCHVILPRWR